MSEKTTYMSAVENAFISFEQENFSYGDTIPTDWFWKKFYLKRSNDYEQMSRNQILHNRYLGALRNKLLSERQMWLVPFEGVGQRIVHPKEQTEMAMKEVKSKISKEIKKASLRLSNVNVALLSQSEKRENSDAIAQMTFFANRSKKQLVW